MAGGVLSSTWSFLLADADFDLALVLIRPDRGRALKRRGGYFCGAVSILLFLSLFLSLPVFAGQGEFKEKGVDPDQTYALLINCGTGYTIRGENGNGTRFNNKPVLVEDPLSERILAEIENYVSQGGYLFTNDRSYQNLIARTKNLSSYLQETGKTYEESESVAYRIWPRPGATSHPLMKNVFIDTGGIYSAPETGGVTHRNIVAYHMNIYPETRLFRAVRPDVNVLLTAPGLHKKYGEGTGAVAVTFFYGGPKTHPGGVDRGLIDKGTRKRGGRVLHILGHIRDERESEKDPVFQQMLMNFLIEGRLRSMNLDRD